MDHFEVICKNDTDFLVKKVRSGSDLAKKFRIHNTGLSVPDFLKRKLIVETNRIHYGSGSKKGQINANSCGYGSKTLVGTPTGPKCPCGFKLNF